MKQGLLVLLCMIIGISITAQDSLSVIHIDFEDCTAFWGGSQHDYSEFTAADLSSVGCSNIALTQPEHVYRTHMSDNGHSCTPGIIPDTKGMCIGASNECSYSDSDLRRIRFNVVMSPGKYGLGKMDSLTFFQKAPESYNYSGGDSGPNNYPVYFAVRILKNGIEIFKQTEISTSRDWTKFKLDLSSLSAFREVTNAIFQFEILPYCLVGNGAGAQVFDLDELYIYAGCNPIDAGEVSTNGSLEVCSATLQDNNRSFSVQNVHGPNSTWLVTDMASNILRLSASSTIDFSTLSQGHLQVYHMVYETGLKGLQEGARLPDLSGKYDLSNTIGIANNRVVGGTLTNDLGFVDSYLCPGETSIQLNLSGEEGANTRYVLTDANRQIINISSVPVLNVPSALEFPYYAYALSYNGLSVPASIGQSINEIGGCHALSNAFRIIAESRAGSIAVRNGSICIGDGVADMLDVEISGQQGRSRMFVLTNTDWEVIRSFSNPNVDLDDLPMGDCLLWLITGNRIDPIEPGAPIFNTTGDCLLYSTQVPIQKENVTVGNLMTISGQTRDTVCVTNNLLSQVELVPEMLGSGNYIHIITDTDNNILETETGNTINFQGTMPGLCRVWSLGYPLGSVIDGYASLDELMNAGFCFDLSDNFVEITRVDEGAACGELNCEVEAGSVELLRTNFCVTDGEEDFVLGEVSNSNGAVMQLVVTDSDSLIIALPDGFGFDVDASGPGSCIVWNIASDIDLDLEIGISISAISAGCFDISEGVVFSRIENRGGEVQLSTGATSIEICVLDSMQLVTLETNGTGLTYEYIITDEDNVILSRPIGSVLDFASSDVGVCRIWGLAHNSTFNAMAGEILIEPEIAGRCFDLSSNFVEVNRIDSGLGCEEQNCIVEGGLIDLFGSSYCVGDGEEDFVRGEVQNAVGSQMQLVVTDADSTIIALPNVLFLDVEDAEAGSCIVWNIAYEGSLNLETGMHLWDITADCFDISEGATFTRIENNGGAVALAGGATTQEFCVFDSLEILLALETSGSGETYEYLLTDQSNIILDRLPADIVDLTTAAVGIYRVWGLAHNSTYNAMVGELLIEPQVPGRCFDLSENFVDLRIVDTGIDCYEEQQCVVDAGSIDLFGSTFCINDGDEDLVLGEVFNAVGEETQLIVTDIDSIIIALPDDFGFDVDMENGGICILWHLASDAIIALETGVHIETISATCFDISEGVVYNKIVNDGGEVSLFNGETEFEFCILDSLEVLLSFATTGGGNTYEYIVTDEDNVILERLAGNTIDLTEAEAGVCRIWGMATNSVFNGMAGELLIEPEVPGRCFDLSDNFVTVTRIDSGPDCGVDTCTTEAGVIELFQNVWCTGDESEDIVDGNIIGADGQFQQLAITNANGTIIGLPSGLGFNLSLTGSGSGSGLCYLSNIVSTEPIALELGESLDAASLECIDISPAVGLEKILTESGEIAMINGETSASVCSGDGVADVLTFQSTNAIGDNFLYLITDDAEVILEIVIASVFDFDTINSDIYRVYGLSYTGSLFVAVGDTLSNPLNIEGCYELTGSFLTITNDSLLCMEPELTPELSIVFNRVSEVSQIFDIKNVSSDTIDVSDYWLCRGLGAYNRIGDVVIECGTFNLNMAPGDILGINLSVSNADGELGLYTSDDFTSAEAMIHYVEWGAAGHARSGVAIEAGLWSVNDFVPAIEAFNSIYFSGTGYSSQSWTEAQTTFCTDLEVVAPVVFHRIGESSQIIDLKNISQDTVDINELVIAVGSWSSMIASLPKECGTTSGILAPGEKVGIVVIPTGTNGLSNADGEIALYNSDMGGSFADIIDYVEWGSASHLNSSAAVVSGIWSAGDFVPAITAMQSIYYDGEGNASTDYMEGDTNICGEFGGRPVAGKMVVNLFPNPVIDVLSVKLESGAVALQELRLISGDGAVVQRIEVDVEAGESVEMDLGGVEAGMYVLELRGDVEVVYRRVVVVR